MLFTELGFHIQPVKSVFIPSQKLTLLGIVLDSIAMTVKPTAENVQRILSVCATLLKRQMPTIKQVAEAIGILVSNFQPAYYFRCTQYVALPCAISCDLPPSDVMWESQSNFNLQVSLV